MKPKQLLILNRRSGKIQSHAGMESRFDSNLTEVIDLTRDVNLTERLGDLCDSGSVEKVIAAGGDGTVNAVVNAMMSLESQKRPKLAILPLGTANDFAHTLRIPDAVDDAIALLDCDQYLPVDVVRIRAENYERYYANVAAGGNSVRVSETMTEEMKSRWGALCYLRGGIEVLSHLATFRITALCDDEEFRDFDAWAVLVANGTTNAGRILVAPNASPTDGLFDVILIRDGTIVDMVEIVSGALLGNYLECEQVEFRQAKRLQLHSEPGMRFTLDGEVIDEEPIEFDLVPGAIRMLVGTEFLLENAARLERQPTEVFYGHGPQNA